MSKLKKIRSLIREHFPEKKFLARVMLIIDVIWASLLYGGAIDDYFIYQFYLRTHAARRDFIVWRKRRKMINICNNKADRELFGSKSRFNKIFAEFLGREWLNVTEASFEEFAAFVSRHKSFFVKRIYGSFGMGARIQRVEEGQDLRLLYADLQQEKVQIEEIIVQHEEMAEFNPSSVNTMRLVTLITSDGTVKVMTATLKLGFGDKCVDHLHHQGIAAAIDIPTGIVVSKAMSMGLVQHVLHPVSQKPILGFRIPHWEKVLETVKAAAKVIPSIRYVGWDVAIGKDGRIIIVEGNSTAGQDASQMPDQVGKWPLYIEEVKAIRKSASVG